MRNIANIIPCHVFHFENGGIRILKGEHRKLIFKGLIQRICGIRCVFVSFGQTKKYPFSYRSPHDSSLTRLCSYTVAYLLCLFHKTEARITFTAIRPR